MQAMHQDCDGLLDWRFAVCAAWASGSRARTAELKRQRAAGISCHQSEPTRSPSRNLAARMAHCIINCRLLCDPSTLTEAHNHGSKRVVHQITPTKQVLRERWLVDQWVERVLVGRVELKKIACVRPYQDVVHALCRGPCIHATLRCVIGGHGRR